MRGGDNRRTWFGLGGQPSLPAYLKPGRGKRLKGLDEFERPEFVGRMSRADRRRELAWYVMLAGATAVGVGIGLVIF